MWRRCDLAYQVGTSTVSGTDSAEQGNFVNVLKRQPDGTWKVAVTIFSSDKP